VSFIRFFSLLRLHYRFVFFWMLTFALSAAHTLLHEKKKSFAVALWYIDDVLSINNNQFQSHVDSIYPNELEMKDTTESSTSASYLDVLLKLDTNGKITTQLYDKLDDFNFSIVNFPYLCSNSPASLHMVYIYRSLFDMQELVRHTISF
jgi:hypothetical protein